MVLSYISLAATCSTASVTDLLLEVGGSLCPARLCVNDVIIALLARQGKNTKGLFLNASEDCRDVLEKKIGSQLEEATLDDLLIPNYSYLNEMLCDVDCVERILGYFLDNIKHRSASEIDGGDNVPRSLAFKLGSVGC
ncbi:hypothetical protein HN51_032042 [Arachis hypogaea]